MSKTKIAELQLQEQQWFQEAWPVHVEVSQLSKKLYNIIHQAEMLVDNLDPNLQTVHDSPIQDKLNTLVELKTSIVTI